MNLRNVVCGERVGQFNGIVFGRKFCVFRIMCVREQVWNFGVLCLERHISNFRILCAWNICIFPGYCVWLERCGV